MPIVIDGKTFESFEDAVAHVKRTKPDVASPEGYVATVERKQRGAKIEELKARIAAIVGRPKTQKERQEEANTYAYEMGRRLGTGEQGLPDLEKDLKGLTKYVATGTKIRPPKPTQRERKKIISAKQKTEIECPKTNLAKLKTRLAEIKITKEHKHAIQFKQAKRIGETGEFRGATQEKYWKYWLLNAKQTNGNGWGVSSDSIDSNISKFIGRPFCVTARQWFPESEYETYEHPYLPTNNLDIIFSHQAKYSVGDIVDVMKDANGDYYAMIKPHSKFASHSPPAFCSPAIFQLDPHEPENKISKWEALHLAGLDRDPAYGAQIALLKGTCVGTANECKVQFKSAKQQNAGVGLPKGFDEHKSDTDVSPFILPKYSEADYEAYRDYVQDSAFHVEDAADAGLEEEDAIESSKYRWKNMPEEYKQVLRPYYQKQMAHELPWQKDPEQYVSGKIPAENQVYIKPNFHKNLKPRYDDLAEKYPNFDYLRHREESYGNYLDIDPKDIVPKTTRAFDNPEKYAKMKSKVRSALISTGPNESKPNTKSKRIDKIVPYFEKPPMEGMSESDAEAEDKAISEYINDSKKINPKELGRNKINPKLKKRLAKQHLAVSYNKHYIFDEFTPRQYGRDDVPSLLDRVADDVEQHASVIGKKILDSGNLHPKSYSKLADTFDSMTRDTLLRIQNNYGNDFEDIQGNEHDIFTNEAENVAETGKYLHRKDFGMENPEEIRRPEGAAELLGEALLEPFRRMKEEHMAGVPKEDYFKGNKLIDRFSNELYGKAYQSLQKRSGMLGASQKKAYLNPNTTKQKWMRFIYKGKEECEICRQFDGKVYRTDDENRPVIPRMEEWNGSGPITHPNCKCMWAKTFSEEGLKSQEKRKVPIFSFRLSKSDKTRSELIQHALNRKATGAAKEDIFEDLIDNHGADGVTARQVVESINWKSKNAKLDILKAKLENMQKTNTFGQHSIIDQEGNILEKSGYDHYDMARDYFGLKADKSGNRPEVSDYDIHKMLSENNWIRVQNFSRSRNPHLSIHVAKPVTPQQAKTLIQLHEDNPNTDVGYFMGPTVETAVTGSAPSMKQVLMESRKAFGTAKTAQEVHPFVTQYKEYRKDHPANPKGFTYSPRLGRDLETPDMLKVGKGTAVHYIGVSNNKEAPVEETSRYIKALQNAGVEPHIGGWTDKGVNYIDASYALVTDNPHEVQRHLIKHGQDAAYTVLPDGRTPTTWNLEKHPDVPDEDKSNPFNTKSYFLKFKP